MSIITSDQWRLMIVSLVQAMLGAISPNFRMISISHDGSMWCICFFLERESEEDRIEIEDIACEFESLQESLIEYRVSIVVGDSEIPWPKLPERVIYKRRE